MRPSESRAGGRGWPLRPAVAIPHVLAAVLAGAGTLLCLEALAASLNDTWTDASYVGVPGVAFLALAGLIEAALWTSRLAANAVESEGRPPRSSVPAAGARAIAWLLAAVALGRLALFQEPDGVVFLGLATAVEYVRWFSPAFATVTRPGGPPEIGTTWPRVLSLSMAVPGVILGVASLIAARGSVSDMSDGLDWALIGGFALGEAGVMEAALWGLARVAKARARVELAAGNVPRRRLRDYVERHNTYVRARDGASLDRLAELFTDDATFRFEGIDAGPYVGREAIRDAFRNRPPTDVLRPLEDPYATTAYAWGDEEKASGHLTARTRGDAIAELTIVAALRATPKTG